MMRALIVDASPAVTEVLSRQMSAWGLHCRTTADGTQALQLLRSAAAGGAAFSLVIVDHSLVAPLDLIQQVQTEPSLKETALIVMLETAEGIDNAVPIAALPGIDVLLIGSGDLTTDYGIPGQIDHPRLREAYERVAAARRDHGKVLGVGGIRHNVALQGKLIRLGARFVIAGTDVNYVLAGARQDTTALRAIPLG